MAEVVLAGNESSESQGHDGEGGELVGVNGGDLVCAIDDNENNDGPACKGEERRRKGWSIWPR